MKVEGEKPGGAEESLMVNTVGVDVEDGFLTLQYDASVCALMASSLLAANQL